MTIGGAVVGGTPNSNLFVGAGGLLAEDPAGWVRDPLGRIGIGTAAPAKALHIVSASALSGVAVSAQQQSQLQLLDATGAANTGFSIVRSPLQDDGQQLSILDDSGLATRRLTIDAAGNLALGIGTAPPAKLTVEGNASIGLGFAATPSPANGLAVQGSVGVGTQTPSNNLSVQGNVGIGAAMAGQVAPPNGAIIDGAVGIGTNAPIAKLNVQALTAGSRLLALKTLDNSAANPITETFAADNSVVEKMYVAASGAAVAREVYAMTSAGAARDATFVQYDSSDPANAGHLMFGISAGLGPSSAIANAAYITSNFGGTGTLRPLIFTMGGGFAPTERVRLATDGRLGIGTPAPATLMDVNGDVATRATTPAAFGVSQDNFAVGAFSFARLAASVALLTVSGFAGGVDGKRLVLANVGANAFTILDQDAGSLAANRVITGTGVGEVISVDETRELIYDAVSSRWRMLG